MKDGLDEDNELEEGAMSEAEFRIKLILQEIEKLEKRRDADIYKMNRLRLSDIVKIS